MKDLENNIAFVTGGAQGLGRGIAIELAKAGADIVIGDLNLKKAETVAAEIRELGRKSLALNLDVTDGTSINRAVDSALGQFPHIDIVVNNAGVVQKTVGDETTAEDFDFCYGVNLKAVWQMTQAIIPHFKSRHQGSIVNISSGAGRGGNSTVPAYSASKAGVINLTQSQAMVLAPFNINVNAVCPGLIWTPMWEQLEGMVSKTSRQDEINEQSAFKVGVKNTPLQRPVTAEDIGQAVVFLASPQAKNITGQSLNVDGGLIMS